MTRLLLGSALLAQGKYDEAEPLLEQGYKGLRQSEGKILPTGFRHLTEYLERLARLCEAAGRSEEASAWRTRLEAHRKGEKPRE
jgi:hypothetical protein